MTRTIVIGAGAAGLATAALLAREGHEVRVLERGEDVGGRAGTLERDGFRFDTGPSWYLMPTVYEHFFRLLGTSSEEQLRLRRLDPAYAVFREPEPGGEPEPPFVVPLGADRVRAAFEAREPGAGRRLAAYLDSAERASVMAERYFLYNPYTRLSSLLRPEVLRSLPSIAGLLTRSLESFVARRFRDPLLRQVLGYPAVFLAATPASAPAMYHLMSSLDLADGVHYPEGGFWELMNRLAALATGQGARIETGALVERIVVTGRGRGRRACGVVWRDREGNRHREEADVVVSAADLHHTETRLLGPRDRTYPERWWRRRTSGPGAVLVLLGVRGRLPELPHHSLFFTRDWARNFGAIFGRRPHVPDPASIYVCKPSQTDAGVAPVGQENLFVLVPVPADPALGHGGADGGGSAVVEEVADRVIEQIAGWAGIPDLAERVVVRETIGPADFVRDFDSWRGGMLGPAHVLSQSAMFRAQNASRRVRNLYYAGATTAPGVGVPMCLISAELVLKRIRGDHGAGPTRPLGDDGTAG
ncbi:MAG: phytoene desaturase [Salana multivorans]|uniref:phytoene desaturase family protein n=1 Tax=Salana multivorans TaxID=120377 RepID=UPI00095F805A|nr:phytoene desaturase family protein [Salana multivorans]MBN8880741.1 phytoene desaturase [Salana multivorans]OJX94719.1 MAG: phytoene dehydrogenase [Micrococcales bacterium 73-15]